jgi:hypothetical protein
MSELQIHTKKKTVEVKTHEQRTFPTFHNDMQEIKGL